MDTSDLFVVGIASSAGGLSPMIELLENASCHKNMCFVIVSHIDRFRESAIAKIVKQVSRLSTQVIVDGLELEHCGIYVIPPNQYVYLEGHRFRLMVRPTGGPNNCADFFFESLAKNFGANAIGVVLSGAAVGADGDDDQRHAEEPGPEAGGGETGERQGASAELQRHDSKGEAEDDGQDGEEREADAVQ